MSERMTETYKFPGATVRVHYGKRTEEERKKAIEEAVKRLVMSTGKERPKG